jgi:hypothetical protein
MSCLKYQWLGKGMTGIIAKFNRMLNGNSIVPRFSPMLSSTQHHQLMSHASCVSNLQF